MIDDIDRDILRHLQVDGRLTQRELGQRVGLSPNAAGARVQRLIDSGVITGFAAQVDHGALGRPIEAFIDVWQRDDHDRETFFALAADDERIVECVDITGQLDFRIKVRVASPQDLSDLLARMRNEGGVRTTDSRFVLEHLETQAPLARRPRGGPR